MVHTYPDTLSDVIKAGRRKANITVEALAEKVGSTERYIYRIENEGKKPSYNILFNLIRVLNLSPDLIFYPEKPSKDSEMEDLVRLLYNCDERSMEIIKATAKAAVSGQGK